ncbi:MAG TPA: universal stress protein [Bryobacteraceae bacterium]
MLPISRILFPVDFSDHCHEVLAYVKVFAAKYKSEIILLHVVNPLVAIPDIGILFPTALPLPEWLRSRQAEKLEFFGKEELEGFPVRRLLVEGEPEEQIVATAQAEKAQLVVMPTRGYGRLRRFLIGSTTAKALHDLDCPVLTLSHSKPPREENTHGIATIACAVDVGPHSSDVLAWAARLACDFQSRLSIVHAVPPLDPTLRIVVSSNLEGQMKARLRRDIERIQSTLGMNNSTICIDEGKVAETVCSYANSIAADLLVVGRGAKGSEHGRFGKHAYSIIRESYCPVLSV